MICFRLFLKMWRCWISSLTTSVSRQTGLMCASTMLRSWSRKGRHLLMILLLRRWRRRERTGLIRKTGISVSNIHIQFQAFLWHIYSVNVCVGGGEGFWIATTRSTCIPYRLSPRKVNQNHSLVWLYTSWLYTSWLYTSLTAFLSSLSLPLLLYHFLTCPLSPSLPPLPPPLSLLPSPLSLSLSLPPPFSLSFLFPSCWREPSSVGRDEGR